MCNYFGLLIIFNVAKYKTKAKQKGVSLFFVLWVFLNKIGITIRNEMDPKTKT